MTQHYPKGTVEVSAWCKRCHKDTMHKVYDGHVQSCLVCLEVSETKKPAKQRPPAPVQMSFSDIAGDIEIKVKAKNARGPRVSQHDGASPSHFPRQAL